MAHSEYVSFLLRLWPSARQGRPVWRATLCQVQGEQQYHFSNLAALTDFLKHEFCEPAPHLPGETEDGDCALAQTSEGLEA